MRNLKLKLSQNRNWKLAVGLKTATKEEIEDIKQHLKSRGIPFRIASVPGTNGTLYINY